MSSTKRVKYGLRHNAKKKKIQPDLTFYFIGQNGPYRLLSVTCQYARVFHGVELFQYLIAKVIYTSVITSLMQNNTYAKAATYDEDERIGGQKHLCKQKNVITGAKTSLIIKKINNNYYNYYKVKAITTFWQQLQS